MKRALAFPLECSVSEIAISDGEEDEVTVPPCADHQPTCSTAIVVRCLVD